MTTSIKTTKIVLIIVITLTFGPLFSQNSYPFNSYCDELKEFDSNDPEILKASFLLPKIDSLINKDFDFAQIGILKFNGKEYFTMYGLKMGSSNMDTIYSIISDFPCPEDCVPPTYLKDSIVINGSEIILGHKFDKADICDVRWQSLAGLICINVRRATHYNKPTLAIYGVTQDAKGNRERININANEEVYISVNGL